MVVQERRKKTISLEIKRLILLQYDRDPSISTISANLGLARTTVSSIVNREKKSEGVAKKRGGKCSSKMTDVHKQAILSWVDTDATFSLKDIAEKIHKEFNIDISKSIIDRILKDFHCSLKILTIVPERRNDERTLALRVEYARAFNSKLLNYESRRLFS